MSRGGAATCDSPRAPSVARYSTFCSRMPMLPGVRWARAAISSGVAFTPCSRYERQTAASSPLVQVVIQGLRDLYPVGLIILIHAKRNLPGTGLLSAPGPDVGSRLTVPAPAERRSWAAAWTLIPAWWRSATVKGPAGP